jgi:uncharacterized membrane protein
MFTLFKWALLAAGIASVVAFVPINGRTTLARWNDAKSVSVFVGRSWQELEKVVAAMTDKQLGRHASNEPAASERARRPAARTPTKNAVKPAAAKPTPDPVEPYTNAEREAVDRILAEHLKH